MASGPFPITDVIITLSVVLLVAKMCGEIFQRVFKVPGVLGELFSGVLIGYHALGGIPIELGFGAMSFTVGPLFNAPITDFTDVTNSILFAMGQIGAIVLMFYVGIQTNINSIISTGKKAIGIAIGGVVLPFGLGFWAVYQFTSLMPSVPDNLLGMALFVGAVMTATSVSVTARVLEGVGKLDSKEGVAILSASVIDDILAIITVIGVISLAVEGTFQISAMAKVFLISTLFLLVMMYGGLKLHKQMTFVIKRFRTRGSVTTIAIVVGLVGAYVAESIGLAMIIGAYAAGILFSKTEVVHTMKERVRPISFIFVPLFFSTVGMLIDLASIFSALALATIITILAFIGKIVGCGGAAKMAGFNNRQSLIIGFGMTPRGEVALIIEAQAFILGIIPIWLFGVAALMTIITTFVAPAALAKLFDQKGEEDDLNRL